MKLRVAGLAIAFLGFALVFAALSWSALDRGTTAWLSVAAGIVVFLLGRRLLLAAGSAGAGQRMASDTRGE